MTATTYQVTGMTCGHCEAAVMEEVVRVAGVMSAEVSAQTGTLAVVGQGPVEDAAVLAAVEEAGYEAVRLS